MKNWTRRDIAGLREELERDYERESIEMAQSLVYFVQVDNGPESPIKIGITSRRDLANRMGGLQTGCPYKLKLLAVMDGGYNDEQRLHKSFKHAHVIGEWFRPTAALLALIEGLKAGKGRTVLTSEFVSDTRRHDPDVSQCP